MNYREARNAARNAEHAFSLPNNATLELIHKKLERKHGRTITIGESGSSARTGTSSSMHRPNPTGTRHQIILHEFSHMILEHDREGLSNELVKSLLPDLDGERGLLALAAAVTPTTLNSPPKPSPISSHRASSTTTPVSHPNHWRSAKCSG
ncbi:hypothetical protein J7I84_01510 [Arthrobacter sp. ISL-85]|uniref:hypothetical protein n=1 Tax=Arthrobacter sp. ISL-85 TaxID=2819115 RepID=UPI001BECE018|nr:hypothetical protein [Arthrobacter sp. ISL-85]MBT2565185.1 hypothetical protein [Arthrobacter sp. ISL-85]